jgi:hypothetical protein
MSKAPGKKLHAHRAFKSASDREWDRSFKAALKALDAKLAVVGAEAFERAHAGQKAR